MADSVNLASFLFSKRNQISLHKMRSGEAAKILIVGVLEKRGLFGIRNLDLKMNVFGVARRLCMLNLMISCSFFSLSLS